MGRSKGQNAKTTIERIFNLISKLSTSRFYSVKELSEYFDCDENTIYRDKNTILNLGYDLEEYSGKFKIKSYGNKNYKLDEGENRVLKSALEVYKMSSIEKEIILKKLNRDNVILTPELLNLLTQLEMVKSINYAIKHQRKITICHYQSTNPQSKSRDRHVVPLIYDENKQTFQAFEDHTIKNFRLSRMKDIAIGDPFDMRQTKWTIPQIDTFGIAGDLSQSIELLLTDRATSLMREEFQEVNTFIQKIDHQHAFTHMIKLKVAGYEGVGRFVLGMMTEIKIISNEGFKDYIKEKIINMTLF